MATAAYDPLRDTPEPPRRKIFGLDIGLFSQNKNPAASGGIWLSCGTSNNVATLVTIYRDRSSLGNFAAAIVTPKIGLLNAYSQTKE
jgi:hypothetical protein